MSYKINPENFSPLITVAGCIIENKEKILLLKRRNTSIQGKKWGIPSGKVKKKESLLSAIQREIKEETGIKFKKDKIKMIRKYNVRHIPGKDFVYHLFYTPLLKKENVKVNKKEHIKSKWINPKSALKLSLVEGTEECIKDFYELLNSVPI